MTITIADLSRRITSGGVYGYYDGWPTGTVVQYDGQGVATPIGSISYISGLHNTLKVSQTLVYGASVEFLFGQLSSDPLALPLPNLFDVNFVLGASLELELANVSVEVGSIQISADYLTIEIGSSGKTYTRSSLDGLSDDLIFAGVPAALADDIEAAISTSMDAITTIQAWAFDVYSARVVADFSAMQDLVDIDLASGMATTPGIQTMVNIGQLRHAIGTSYDDSIRGTSTGNLIYGGDGNDSITGGGGSDSLDGGNGSDTLDGGSGYDLVSYASSLTGVTVNLGANSAAVGANEADVLLGIEAVVGSAHGDNVTVSANTTVVLAGLAGDDTFNINTSGGSPTIVWGGEGSDTVSVQLGQDLVAPAGILVVNAEGITEENFHLLDLEELGMGSSFDWSAIDVVLINPDVTDRIELTGTTGGFTLEVCPAEQVVWRSIQDENGDITYEPYGLINDSAYQGSLSFGSATYDILGFTGLFNQEFIGGYSGPIFSATGEIDTFSIVECRDSEGPFIQVSGDLQTGEHSYDSIALAQALGLGGSGWDGEIDRDYDLSSAAFSSQWDTVNGDESREHFFYYIDRSSPLSGASGWFMIGGSLSEAIVVGNGAISVVMPDTDGEGPGDDDEIRGGRYGDSSSGTNLVGEEGVTRVTGFDASLNSVTIRGVALDASSLPSGVTASEVNGSTIITYGQDDHVVLRGVALSDWQAGSAGQNLGDAGDNSLAGSSANDVFAGGGGNDTIEAGAGDDRINYASGNDVILGNGLNLGSDVLDLRRFARGDVSFSVFGLDVLITTADGTILLESQVRREIGDHRSNIETILFSDGVLAEADIRLRAIADQCTVGSDSVQGTGLDDTVDAGEGDDTILAAAGNDTLYGGQGNDSLDGGAGADDMRGQLGDDVYVVDAVDDVVTEEAGEGSDLVFSRVTWHLGDNAEDLTLIGPESIDGTGNSLANMLTGNASDNSLDGLEGDDTLGGGSGNDTLVGGVGNDLINGGAGSDQMFGGAGDDVYLADTVGDVVSEALGEGVDRVESGVTWSLTANIENLTLTGSVGSNGTGNDLHNIISGNSGANSIAGLDGNDSLFGNNGNDTIYGGAGNDSLDGGAGNDSMVGGDGDDTFVISATTDVVVEDANGGIDHVRSVVSWTLGASVENLTLLGTSTITGTGNAGSNLITGNAVANRLNGLDGNDTLTGGDGNDTLTGGTGADQFVFTASANGVDVIADFNELDGGGEEGDVLRFDAASQVGTFVFLGTGAFSGGSDNSEARVSGNQVLVDTNGDALADITITLTGLSSASQLATSDFLFA